MVPEWSQYRPKWSKYGPNMVPMCSQNDPKLVPIWSLTNPNMVPIWSQCAPRMTPSWSRYGPGPVPIWLHYDPILQLHTLFNKIINLLISNFSDHLSLFGVCDLMNWWCLKMYEMHQMLQIAMNKQWFFSPVDQLMTSENVPSAGNGIIH